MTGSFPLRGLAGIKLNLYVAISPSFFGSTLNEPILIFGGAVLNVNVFELSVSSNFTPSYSVLAKNGGVAEVEPVGFVTPLKWISNFPYDGKVNPVSIFILLVVQAAPTQPFGKSEIVLEYAKA